MSRVCAITGKRTVRGNNVSKANNKTRRRFLPNLARKKIWIESEKRFIRLRISHAGQRVLDKRGTETVLRELGYLD